MKQLPIGDPQEVRVYEDLRILKYGTIADRHAIILSFKTVKLYMR
jgi:hypothetical protein